MDADFYTNLAKQSLQDERVVSVLAKVMEEKMVAAMRRQHGGERVYVAKTLSTCEREKRDEAIRKEFCGNNIKVLHRRHNLSTRQIRRVVAQKPCNDQNLTR